MNFSIQQIKKSEVKEFALKSLEWVIEADMKPLKREIEDMQKKMAYIEHCWICKDSKVIGVINLTDNSFFSVGLSPEALKLDLAELFRYVTLDILAARPSSVLVTIYAGYWVYLSQLGFVKKFGREKWKLKLADAKNLIEHSDIKLVKLSWKNFDKIMELFLDAYKNTIDDEIGLFSPSYAYNAMNYVKKGGYGKVLHDLSYFCIHNNKLEGGVITSINEGELFIVIIGVRRSVQRKKMGRKLMSLVIEKGKQKKYNTIRLWVTKENGRAIEFYESLGFQKTLEITNGSLDVPSNYIE